MPLAIPERSGQRFLVAINRCYELTTAIRDQTGDLTFRLINDLQRCLLELEISYSDLADDAAVVPAVVRDYIATRGGPTGLGPVQAAVVAFGVAASAYRVEIRDAARSLSSADLIVVRSTSSGGATLRTIEAASAIPGATAAALRTSTNLAAMITELEVLGA